MEINGFKLPLAFVQDLENQNFLREYGSWQLRSNANAYGEPLETELGCVFETETQIQQETNALPGGYINIPRNEIEEYTRMFGRAPGEIPYIWDFSHIICFAIAADGAPFCFDYKENAQEPSVIWWADAYWQRIAPSYKSFVGLFHIAAENA